jgi:hypothetical protein
VIPGAKVVLTNQANLATSSMKSNGEGFFHFAGIQVATYNLEISYKGFETWKVTGITVHPGDDLSIPKINLRPGAVTESVTVTADVAGVSLSNGEHSTLITADQIKRLSTVGRDANELISMLPGFSVINTSGVDNIGADYQTTGPGYGNLNSFTANGSAPQQGLVNVTSDGANLIDPGDMGGQLANDRQVGRFRVSWLALWLLSEFRAQFQRVDFEKRWKIAPGNEVHVSWRQHWRPRQDSWNTIQQEQAPDFLGRVRVLRAAQL